MWSDMRWAVRMLRAKRHRHRIGFAERVRFDDALRPRIDGERAVIAYPDAVYHAKGADFARAWRVSPWGGPKP